MYCSTCYYGLITYIIATTAKYFALNILVPNPSVNINILNNQTVGQLLIMKCDVTTVRGITSRVDIVWRSDGSELSIIEEVNTSAVINNSMIFRDTYIITQLSTADENKEYQCEVSIDTQSPVTANDSVRLNVTGKY